MRNLCVCIFVCFLSIGTPVHAGGPDRHEVTVDGHPLAVWSRSASSPTAVMLLVHGRTWSTVPDFDLQVPGEDLSLMAGLVEAGITVYGVDLRGYGETPRDASGWNTPERSAADVAGVLNWVAARHPDLTSPYLFGWSNGALVSQLAVQLHADRVSGLILFGYPIRRSMMENLPTEYGEPARAETTAEAAASDFILPGTISEAAIDAFVRAALAADPVRTDWRDLDQWLQLDGAAISVPTLLLQAEHDPLAMDDVHLELFANLDTNDKSWVVIPGGDHAAFMESPRPYFLSVISAFISRGQAPDR